MDIFLKSFSIIIAKKSMEVLLTKSTTLNLRELELNDINSSIEIIVNEYETFSI